MGVVAEGNCSLLVLVVAMAIELFMLLCVCYLVCVNTDEADCVVNDVSMQ
jgi:hypothetical protein